MNLMKTAHKLAKIYKSLARESDSFTYRDYLSIALREVHKSITKVVKYIKRQHRSALVSKVKGYVKASSQRLTLAACRY